MKFLILGLCILVALSFLACGDDDDNAASTSSANVCAQKDAVQVAVTDLASINILAAGTDALHESVDKVKTETAALKDVAGADVADEVDALDSAVSQAEDTVSSLDNGGTVNEKIDELQSAFTEVATTATALGEAMQKDCG
jgi:hypothetical protein